MSTVLLLSSFLLQATPPAQTPPQPNPCPVATDAELGRVPAKAIRIGGGALDMAARERRYFDSLRGPGGETLTYVRKGSTAPQPGQRGPLDIYEVKYEGLEQPLVLYVDAYHYQEMAAPAGFRCDSDRLGPPPIDAFMAMDLGERLAIAQGSEKDLAPISLDADGSSTHGVAFDRFLLVAREARAAAAAGSPLKVAEQPTRSAQRGLAVVAYPQKCADRVVMPVSIEIGSAQGGVKPSAASVSGDALTKLVPGLTAPEGSIGQAFGLANFRPGDAVRISYSSELCTGGAKSIVLPVQITGMRGVNMPQPPLPEGFTMPVAPVWLQVVVDIEGRLQQATYIGGPEALVEAAIASLREWRAEPARVNGTPITADSIVVIRFR
jgi:hypothetical protein